MGLPIMMVVTPGSSGAAVSVAKKRSWIRVGSGVDQANADPKIVRKLGEGLFCQKTLIHLIHPLHFGVKEVKRTVKHCIWGWFWISVWIRVDQRSLIQNRKSVHNIVKSLHNLRTVVLWIRGITIFPINLKSEGESSDERVLTDKSTRR